MKRQASAGLARADLAVAIKIRPAPSLRHFTMPSILFFTHPDILLVDDDIDDRELFRDALHTLSPGAGRNGKRFPSSFTPHLPMKKKGAPYLKWAPLILSSSLIRSKPCARY